MAQNGIFIVYLVGVKSPRNPRLGRDAFVKGRDLYVKLRHDNQQRKSKVVSGRGSALEWNEAHGFAWSGDHKRLEVRIFDAAATDDGFIGEAKVPLDDLLTKESIPAAPYKISKDGQDRGEVQLALTLIPGGPRGDFAYPPHQFWTFTYVTALALWSFKMFKVCMIVGDIPVRGLCFMAFVLIVLLVFLASA